MSPLSFLLIFATVFRNQFYDKFLRKIKQKTKSIYKLLSFTKVFAIIFSLSLSKIESKTIHIRKRIHFSHNAQVVLKSLSLVNTFFLLKRWFNFFFNIWTIMSNYFFKAKYANENSPCIVCTTISAKSYLVQHVCNKKKNGFFFSFIQQKAHKLSYH